ncbi:MAG: hypothetical protein IJN48_03230 [Clostridia bacterium]|nr:hypothetical protein [Clostridia bacterium]
MNENVVNAEVKTEEPAKKPQENNARPFDLSFAFRSKKEPKDPIMTINLKGEISKKVVLVLAAIGAVASIITIIKTVRFIKKFF